MSVLTPVGDRVVVKSNDPDEVSKGGIVLPDVAQERPDTGKVLAVGPGKLLENGTRGEMEVAEGDEVVFGRYQGTDLEVQGEKIKVLRMDDILLVLRR